MSPESDSSAKAKQPRGQPFHAASAKFGFALGARIPFRVSHAVGGALGRLAYSIPGRTRHVTKVNLDLCFPGLSAAEREELGRESTAEAGRLAFELGGIWNWPKPRIESLLRDERGREHLDAALAKDAGTILVAIHFGSWEFMGLVLSMRVPFSSLYKPPRVRELESYYCAGRERFGGRLFPTTPSGVGALVKALRLKQMAGLLPDQDPGQGAGVFAPFFGVQAYTSVLLPRLLQRTGASAVFAATERLPDGSGFRIHYLPAPAGLSSEDPVESATAMNSTVEDLIRIAPAQYLWSYKRFRVRPEGESDPYRKAT